MPDLPHFRARCCARALLLTLLATITATGHTAAQQPELDGRPASWWAARLAEKSKVTGAALRAHGAAALPVLVALLDAEQDQVPFRAARALTKLGAIAKPAAPALLAHLRSSPSWWTQFQCGHALAAIGDDTDEVRDALLTNICTSDVPRLRSECTEALAALCPDPAAVLLEAVAKKRFSDPTVARDLLRRLGERAVPTLLANVGADGARGDVTQEALVAIGWSVAPELERAGHPDLAQRALREGLRHRIHGIDSYEFGPVEPQPPTLVLPQLRFAWGYGHSRTVTVWHATESARGYRVRSIRATRTSSRGDAVQWQLQTQEVTIARSRALALWRQLELLPKLELVGADAPRRRSRSSGDFFARVHARTDDETRLDLRFAGYPSSDNVRQRFPAEAARNVLLEAVRGMEWRDREPDPDDRAAAAACVAEAQGQPGWVGNRLRALATALAEPSGGDDR